MDNTTGYSAVTAARVLLGKLEGNLGSMSVWHWLIVLFWLVVVLVPGWRIATKAGFHGAWALLLLVPIVNLLIVWMFAFVRWPTERAA
jgi:uncharacterized membrane protein YhaH (DUF805 family)